MTDPAAPFRERRSDPDGVGPFRFVYGTDFGTGSLAAGSSAALDLRNGEFNGTTGYYVALSPAGYDTLEVTNLDTSNAITVLINDGAVLDVPPETIQSLGQSGMYRFTVTNEGSTAISSGDVILEVQKDPLGADEAARRRATQSPVSQVIEKFTGLTPRI